MSSSRDEGYKTTLLAAATTKQLSVVKSIPGSALTQHYQYIGKNPLHIAAQNGDTAMAIFLRDHAAKAYQYDGNGSNDRLQPIAFAAQQWQFPVVLALANTPTDTEDKAGYSRALLFAVCHEKHDVAAHLIKMGAKPNGYTMSQYKDHENVNCLHLAVLNHDVKMLKLLTSANANTTEKTAAGLTPLQLATHFATLHHNMPPGYWECVSVLLKAEAKCEENERKEETKDVIARIIPDLSARVHNENLQPLTQADLALFKQLPHNKSLLLTRILDIQDPALQQKALWQALVPQTTLGQLFRVKNPKSIRASNLRHGHLHQIVIKLETQLRGNDTTCPLQIDPAIQKALLADPAFLNTVPTLYGRLQPTDLNERPEGAPEPKKTSWWKNHFPKKLFGSEGTYVTMPTANHHETQVEKKQLDAEGPPPYFSTQKR